MRKKTQKIFPLVFVLAIFLVACATTTSYVRPDTVTNVDTTFSGTDLKMMAEKMVLGIAELSVVRHRDTPPRIALLNIKNGTSQHIDTEGIVNKIMVALLKTGTVRFVERELLTEMAKEKHMAVNQDIDFSNAVQLGKVLKADYFLLGNIMSLEQRRGVKGVAYYKMTLRLVDVNTSEIVWADEKEIKKIARKGYLDW